MAASRSDSGSGPRYAPSEPTLAKPWKELIDGATGNHYFWNPDSGVTQYHRPASSRHRHKSSKNSVRGHRLVEACRWQHEITMIRSELCRRGESRLAPGFDDVQASAEVRAVREQLKWRTLGLGLQVLLLLARELGLSSWGENKTLDNNRLHPKSSTST